MTTNQQDQTEMGAMPTARSGALRAEPQGSRAEPPATIAGRTYRFAELVQIALQVLDYPAAKFIAVSGNLKYLQRQRAIPHYETGRGKYATYSSDDVLRSLVGLELHIIGLTPTQITPILDEHWDTITEAAARGLRALIEVPTRSGRAVMLGIPVGEIMEAFALATGGRA